MVRTVDGGENWTHWTLSANSFLFDVTFTDEDNGYVAGCLNGGSAAAIWRTTNGGASWTYQSFSASETLQFTAQCTRVARFSCNTVELRR